MNPTRLFVLGSLANGGPMHGHQIRLAAQVDRTELWADVKPGSLYGALRRMASEGVIEAVRTEQKGNRPERTIYQITEAGRAEFHMLRDKALRDTRIRPDSVNLALLYCGDLGEAQVRSVMELRRQNLAAELATWEQLHADAAPYLTGLEPLGFEHQMMRIKAEIAWHDLVLERLPKLFAGHDAAGEEA